MQKLKFLNINAYTKDKNKGLNIYTSYLHVAQLLLKIAKKGCHCVKNKPWRSLYHLLDVHSTPASFLIIIKKTLLDWFGNLATCSLFWVWWRQWSNKSMDTGSPLRESAVAVWSSFNTYECSYFVKKVTSVLLFDWP